MTDVDLIVRGGTVVNSDGRRVADVHIGGGTVRAITEPGRDLATQGNPEVIDATGLLVLPGGVDPHCHVMTELGEFMTTDDYAATSTAALWGGTTTIVDFAIPSDGQSPLEAARARTAQAEQARCSVALHACVRRWDDTVPQQLQTLAEEGITTVKLFTTYRELMMIGPDAMVAVMKQMRELGGITYVHAESNHIIEDVQAVLAARGRIGSADHALTRPEISERAAVEEVLAIAEAVDSPVYFVHQTTPEVVDMVSAARTRGVRAYSETCTHYLTLDSTCYDGERPDLFVCCPPLRNPATVAGLQQRLLSGAIATVGSDHCCFHGEDKKRAGHDVRAMPYGLPGVEHRLAVMFSEFVNQRGMSVEQFVDLTATAPARLNGLRDRKGRIAAGADADIVVWDPQALHTVTVSDTHQGLDYDPYAGRELRGVPRDVIIGGRVAIRDRVFVDPGSAGARLHAQPIFARR